MRLNFTLQPLIHLLYILFFASGVNVAVFAQGAGCASYSSASPPPPYDPCVQAVFTADPYCCNTTWDAVCAGAYNPTPCLGGGCSNCSNPTVIGTLPFNMTATTCGACNDFTSSNACLSNYMSGEDYVFAYTPTSNVIVDIALSGTLTWTGLFVTDNCPSSTGTNCLGNSTSSTGNPVLTSISLTAGITYYIVISTWPTPNCTPFTIDITLPAPTCTDGIQNQGETGVDCGGPCPPCGAGGCSNCGNPTTISALPFNATSTTCGACNDYSSLNACASTYMNGEDYVYAYTPLVAEQIDVTLTGTSTYTGVFVTAGCPTSGVCVASSTSAGGNPAINGVSLLAGQTYYIIISTWPAPNCTPFTININGIIPTCSDGLQNGGETGVDCGGPCPPCSGAATAGDCSDAINICTNSSFSVDPSGYGAIDELAGNSVSNPLTNPNLTPGNSGCLLSGEKNSTWMIINIASTGTLEFSLGAPNNITANCYDWILWSYDASACSDIVNNIRAPLSCNWNGTCNSFSGMASIVPPGGYANNFETPLNVICGEQYLICFSNWSSALTTVPFNFTGSASVSCTFFNPVTVNNDAICPGQCASLTATGGSSYSWASSPDLSSTNTATVNACPLTVGPHIYSVTGTGPCGSGTATATVTVLASNDPACTILLSSDLIDFQAHLNSKKQVDLLWQTISETNNAFFTIERSRDGIIFEHVKEVKGAGNSSSTLLYKEKDEDPFFGTSYYRLRQTSYNGNSTYSNIVSINNESTFSGISIHPNPAFSEFTITGRYIENAEISLINNLGIKVHTAPVISERTATFSTDDLTSGLYLIVIKINGISKTKKLIIQK